MDGFSLLGGRAGGIVLSQLYKRKDLTKPILNLAWHLPKEVRRNLLKNGYKGKVIDIKKFKKI